MTKTGLYLQDPKYQVRLGGKADFIRDPSLIFDAPLYKLDGASFMSKDAYGHLCTVTGALWTPRARDFDGVDDLIRIPAASILRPTQITVEVWVYINSLHPTNWSGLIGLESAYPDSGYTLIARESEGISIGVSVEGVWTPLDFGSAVAPLKQWLHAVSTFNGSSLENFVNAASVATLAAPGNITYAANRDLVVGRYSVTSDGAIGEVRVYNRALTPLEIQHNYLATKWRYR